MILIYSATLGLKFQGKFSTLFDCFAGDSSTPVPASTFVKTCGVTTTRKLGNRGRQDHENTTFIHKNGDVPLLQRTIKTPNETIQREIQP